MCGYVSADRYFTDLCNSHGIGQDHWIRYRLQIVISLFEQIRICVTQLNSTQPDITDAGVIEFLSIDY